MRNAIVQQGSLIMAQIDRESRSDGVPKMVRNGSKVLSGGLDGAEWAGLDSLGFGLAWNDPQAQPAWKGFLR